MTCRRYSYKSTGTKGRVVRSSRISLRFSEISLCDWYLFLAVRLVGDRL
jgi:hypothetical protein